ncbi:MAG: hypothetical protein AVDCRST_MAG88-448 [uncultured Thermomicrobiales bacterium]|uniref:Uncharacterized protein n=1 Tax=uncultured Thermomicrobiales bacterium TaxID=1645740 RepID=A0A6J4UBP5_9BACT|nr:MAG: hypothetical protein AVDCRST_MAG88-448 [uncultured Thermomicrobiales bacterium]
MKLSQIEWRAIGRAAFTEAGQDDVPGMAAEMAYHFLFALFPFALFLAALADTAGRLTGEDQLFAAMLAEAYAALPAATTQAVQEPLDAVLREQRGGALSFGAVVALAWASIGVATIMKAFNRAYGVEETRPFLRKKLTEVGLTAILGVLLVGGFVLLVFGGDIGQWLADRIGLGHPFRLGWRLLRLPLALAGVSLGLALLYWKGPNVRQEFKWLTPGSLLTTLAWALGTGVFGLYVRLVGARSYGQFYGPLVGLILFLLYLYLTSVVLLMGAELNAETAKRYDPATIRDKLADPRKQLPGKQPTPHPQAAGEAGVSPDAVAASNVRSAGKLAAGAGSPATATMPARAKHGLGAAPERREPRDAETEEGG